MTLDLSSRRYRTGRRFMLISAALYAIAQAARYLPNPNRDGPVALEFVTVLVPVWIWAGMWLVAAALCLADLIRGRGRLGISSLVGLLAMWASLYLFSYVYTVVADGWGSREWVTVANYGFMAGIILGLITKVGALKAAGEHE